MGDQVVGVEGEGPLPDLVVLPGFDQPVRRRRPALPGVAAQDQGPVGEQALQCGIEQELVGIAPGTLFSFGSVATRDLPATKLRSAFGIQVAQEVTHAVGLVLGHQGRTLPREVLADLLQLAELGARCEPCIVVGEHVG